MKNHNFFDKASWLLAICFAAALALSACKSTTEPSSTEPPSKADQPQKEHPEHPKPADTQK